MKTTRSIKYLYPEAYEAHKQSEKYRLINSMQAEANPEKLKCKESANYTCEICGDTENIDAHHIIPQDQGGPNTQKNLICLCRKCHQQVHKGVYVIDPDTRKITIGLVHPIDNDDKPQYVKDFEKKLGIEIYKNTGKYYGFINGVKTKFTAAEMKAAVGYKPASIKKMSETKSKSIKERKLLAEYKRIAKENGNKALWHFICKAIASWDDFDEETKELIFKIIEGKFK